MSTMTFKIVLLWTFATSMFDNDLECDETGKLDHHAREFLLVSHDFPSDSFDNIYFNSNAAIGYVARTAKNGPSFYGLRYELSDPLAAAQFAHHRRVLEKLLATPFFAWIARCFTDGARGYALFRDSRTLPYHYERLPGLSLHRLREDFFDVIELFRVIESLGAALLCHNSNMLVVTHKGHLRLAPVELIEVHQLGERCYVSVSNLPSSVSPDTPLLVDVYGGELCMTVADRAAHVFSLANLLQGSALEKLTHPSTRQERIALKKFVRKNNRVITRMRAADAMLRAWNELGKLVDALQVRRKSSLKPPGSPIRRVRRPRSDSSAEEWSKLISRGR